MKARLLTITILPILLALVAFGGLQGQPRKAEAAISAPTQLTVLSIGPGAVRLQWAPGTDNIWFCANVAQSLGDLLTGGPTWRNFGCWTTANFVDVSGLGCGVTYYWNVYTWNFTTNTTSNPASFQMPACSSFISPPTNLTTSAPAAGVIRFDWNPGNNNFWFCVNTALSLNDLLTGGPTWSNHGCWTTSSVLDVAGLGCGVTVYWNVYAWNNVTNATSQPASFQTPDCSSLISAPTNLTASIVSPGVIRFDWDRGANNIWYCVNTASSFSDLITGGPTWRNHGCWSTATQLDVVGLPCDSTVYWNVYTWNNVTNATSVAATAQTSPCADLISPPTNLQASSITKTSATLTWTKGLNNTWFCVNTATSESDLLNGGPSWTNHGCGTTSASFNLTNLACGTTYYWNVFTWNNLASTTSDTANFSTTAC